MKTTKLQSAGSYEDFWLSDSGKMSVENLSDHSNVSEPTVVFLRTH